MATLMENLPIEVQEEIRDKRRSIEGWEPYAHATTEQWMTFYDLLGPQARAFLVENMLESAQRGSICLQADHESQYESFMAQLRGVTELHNARVDECTRLRKEIQRLHGALADRGVDEAAAIEAEKAAHPAQTVRGEDLEMVQVQFEGKPAPGHQLYVVPDQAE